MTQPLMPKATAVWLIENTALTFEQIGDFCGIHELEVTALANGEIGTGIVGIDPIATGQLTLDEIKRCEKDENASLELIIKFVEKKKPSKYTPVSKRQDRPNAIAWILKNHPEIEENIIKKLIGTTKATIDAIKNKTHKNTEEIKPHNPVNLGLCSEEDLQKAIDISMTKKEPAKEKKKAKKKVTAQKTSAKKAPEKKAAVKKTKTAKKK